MITAQEKGRRLHIEVGDGDGAESFVIEPVDVETGAALLAHLLGVVAFESTDDPDKAAAAAEALGAKATSMSKLAIGEANYRRVQTLRAAEAKDVVYAGLLWNTEGGGIGVTHLYMDGGLPKALSAVFEAAGLLPTQPSTT